jgi:DNA primase
VAFWAESQVSSASALLDRPCSEKRGRKGVRKKRFIDERANELGRDAKQM